MTRRSSPAVSRRRFLQVSGAGAAALALAACAAPAPAAAPGDDAAMAPVEIDFAAWAGNTDIPAWEELQRVFGEQNSDIVVTTAPSGTGADYYTGLQTSIAGGAPPDIASFQGWEWQPYADAGQLAPLDEYIQESGLSGPYPDGVQSIEDSTRRAGKRYLMPLQVGVMLMLYARQPFDDAGLDYPTNDWTFEEFLSMAEQVTNLDGDNRMYGFQPSGIWPRDIHWIRSTGMQEFDQLVDPTTASFDQPEIIEIVQLLTQDLQYKMGISPTPADMSGGTNTIDTGNAAMKYEGAWFLPNLNSPDLRDAGAEIPFDVVMMPQYLDEGRPHRGWSEGVAVLNTDSVDAAWEYTAFMGGEEGQKDLFDPHRAAAQHRGSDPFLLDSHHRGTLRRVQRGGLRGSLQAQRGGCHRRCLPRPDVERGGQARGLGSAAQQLGHGRRSTARSHQGRAGAAGRLLVRLIWFGLRSARAPQGVPCRPDTIGSGGRNGPEPAGPAPARARVPEYRMRT